MIPEGGGIVDLLEDFEDLVDFRVAREERLAGAHLCKDGTDGPHIDACGVLTTAEEDFWCSVPKCDDLVHNVSLCTFWSCVIPHTSWVYVLSGTPNALARPKSANLRFPSLSMSKF